MTFSVHVDGGWENSSDGNYCTDFIRISTFKKLLPAENEPRVFELQWFG